MSKYYSINECICLVADFVPPDIAHRFAVGVMDQKMVEDPSDPRAIRVREWDNHQDHAMVIVNSLIIWNDTVEGRDYWREVHRRIGWGEGPWPEPPADTEEPTINVVTSTSDHTLSIPIERLGHVIDLTRSAF